MKGMGVVAATCLAALLCAAEAGAQWYGSVKGGLFSVADMKSGGKFSDITAETDTGFRLSAAVGRHLEAFRIEAEAFYGRADYTLKETWKMDGHSSVTPKDKATLMGAMLNGWFDFMRESELIPYLGGGLGPILVDGGDHSDDEGLAWQIGAGAVWKMSESAALDIGYRYLRSAFKPDFGSGIKFDALQSHSFDVGLRFNF